MNPAPNSLPVHLESAPRIAAWLGVAEVLLVREDLLPDSGGKKRRSLASVATRISPGQKIFLLSYAGSHTAFTLAQLLPHNPIHLYGMTSGGGPYQKAMIRRLSMFENVHQYHGSLVRMTLKYFFRKWRSRPEDLFLDIGGKTSQPHETTPGIREVVEQTPGFQHVVAVASGELLRAIRQHTHRVTGVLTQPFLIRCLKRLQLKQTRGLFRPTLTRRLQVVREIAGIHGPVWDPIFTGTVFATLKRSKTLPAKLCIWITCPADIEWDSESG